VIDLIEINIRGASAGQIGHILSYLEGQTNIEFVEKEAKIDTVPKIEHIRFHNHYISKVMAERHNFIIKSLPDEPSFETFYRRLKQKGLVICRKTLRRDLNYLKQKKRVNLRYINKDGNRLYIRRCDKHEL
jgi:hypothetical protein